VYYDRALDLLETNPGANQLILAFTLQQKGDFHAAQRAWPEAVAAYGKSLRLLEAGLGDHHALFTPLLTSYAKALWKDHRKKEAKALDQRARAIAAELKESVAMRRHTVDIRTLRAANP
jgi:hypothetical protein